MLRKWNCQDCFSTGGDRKKKNMMRGNNGEKEKERLIQYDFLVFDWGNQVYDGVIYYDLGNTRNERFGKYDKPGFRQTKFEVPLGIIEEYFMAYLIVHCFAYVKTFMFEVKGIFSRGTVSKCNPIQNKLLNIYYMPHIRGRDSILTCLHFHSSAWYSD